MENSAGRDRTVLDVGSGSVPLYHPLGSGTAVHLLPESQIFPSFSSFFQVLHTPRDVTFPRYSHGLLSAYVRCRCWTKPDIMTFL